MEIKVFPTQQPKPKPADESKLGFGKLFTDHMFIMEHDEKQGWHNARIIPYQNLQLDPASPVLHYGQEIFEGLKAYRSSQGGVVLFRPLENARRMNRSAERLCMPAIDPDIQLAVIKKLVSLEQDWVPRAPGASLYLRPTMIGVGSALGVHPAPRYLYYIICSPSGAYYAGGMSPIRIHMEDKYVRAVKGGVGYAKTGGNYAASLKAAAEAQARGFDQVLWLDGREGKYVEEVGAMNMMFVIGDSVCTAPLEGSILPGVTRDSVLHLARVLGYPVEERRISVEELFAADRQGRLREAFGTGTAAVILPVGEMEYQGRRIVVNENKIGPVTQKLYDHLTGLQTGRIHDSFGWLESVV